VKKRLSPWGEYTTLIEALTAKSKAAHWFRGVGDANHELIELELDILTRFKFRSLPYQNQVLEPIWGYLFFMQHFGVPTRLLDWSENSMVALYFAITSGESYKDRTSGAFTRDAAVWILNTELWNLRMAGPGMKGRILAVPDVVLQGYEPTDDLRKIAANPVAMAGHYNNPRIVAQRGAFTIFGHNNMPMNRIFDLEDLEPDALVKVILPQDHLSDLRDALFRIGYTDSMVYPDLIGLAMEIKRHYGFDY
jgi:FRG domain-containing protein